MANQIDKRYRQAFLALGSNLGSRLENMEKACHLVEKELGTIVKKSSVYETQAWGNSELLPFLNQVIEISTDKSPLDLLEGCLQIELQLGRIRNISSHTYQNRLIDIDLLLYENEIRNSKKLTLPHPKLHQRKFVLIPFAEIAPLYLIETYNMSVSNLLKTTNDTLEVALFQTQ